MARIAPAPAQTPSTAAMTGCGQWRIAFTTSPVMRVNSRSSGIVILVSGPMISCTSPPEQKLPPSPVIDHCPDGGSFPRALEQVAQFSVRLERQRILPLGAVERDDADLALRAPQEMLRRDS